MQVHREGAYWRASKAWCKALQQGDVHAALRSFVDSSCSLQPQDVYGGASGAVAQLQRLAAWFQVCRALVLLLPCWSGEFLHREPFGRGSPCGLALDADQN